MVGDIELAVHLNGDEAMCFGSAFIASNSSSQFKVRKVYLTQHPTVNYQLFITPIGEIDPNSEIEIEYSKNYTMYKETDFFGQKKSLSMTYDKDMTIVVYAEDRETGELSHLSKYTTNGIASVAANDIA